LLGGRRWIGEVGNEEAEEGGDDDGFVAVTDELEVERCVVG